MFKATNPHSGETLLEVPFHTEAEADARVRDGHRAFGAWSRTSPVDRVAPLRTLAGLLEDRRQALAGRITCEMGKPLAQALAEIDKCATLCTYYADHAPGWLEAEAAPSDASDSHVRHDPLGVLLAIMPWNFPHWQVFRAAVPALAAGNTVLLKHAPNVPGCALDVEALFRDAGFPKGALGNLFVPTGRVAELIEDPRVAAVTLTGSEAAGRAVAEQAGAALKPCVLELGGSDAFLVLGGADLDAAAEAACTSRTLNNGQSCIAAKRFITTPEVHEGFVERLAERLAALRVGDPLEEGTSLGPLIHTTAVEQLQEQVRRSIEAGARRALGEDAAGGYPAIFPATLLVDVAPGMPAFDEELFGPVASVVAARDADHAVRLANASRYGLGGTVFADERTARRLVPSLECGHVAVNGMVKSDPRLPFGGVKASGFGRELARDGLLAFVNRKTVWIA